MEGFDFEKNSKIKDVSTIKYEAILRYKKPVPDETVEDEYIRMLLQETFLL